MAILVLSPRNSIAQLVSLHSILNNPLANTLLKIPGSDHVHYHHFNFMAPVYRQLMCVALAHRRIWGVARDGFAIQFS